MSKKPASVPVAILVRVSTLKQETNRQISELQAYAKQKRYNVVEVCRETVSGRADEDTPMPPPPPATTVTGPAEATARDAASRRAGCDDDALHAELLALLKAHDGAEGFMQDDAALSPEIEAELARLKPEKASGSHLQATRADRGVGGGSGETGAAAGGAQDH